MSLFGAVVERERRGGPWNHVAFRKLVSRNLELLHRVELQRKLEAHHGCVNTCSFSPSGDLLVSGSDDRSIILWDWAGGRPVLVFDSGHTNNVFQARCMPYNNNQLVSCAADGQVRTSLLKDDGTATSHLLFRHDGRAHKLAMDPMAPTCFYSCGEDGMVNHFDLRVSSMPARRYTIVPAEARTGGSQRIYTRNNHTKLNAIHVNPTRPWQFAVGGSDQYVRLYDLRQLHRRVRASQRGAEGADPLLKLCPKQLLSSDLHITCVMYSRYGELLTTYNDEAIYLFEAVHTEQQGQHVRDGQEDEENPGADPGPSVPRGQDEPDHVVQRYSGHRNRRTVKGVNFLGEDDEYVMSGSDCGHVFVWGKTDGKLQLFRHGDEDVVNCLERHPFLPHTFATSGIEHDIKIWAPTAADPQPPGADADRVMSDNSARRGQHDGHIMRISHETLLALLRAGGPRGRLWSLFHNNLEASDEEELEASEDPPQAEHSGGPVASQSQGDYAVAAGISDTDSEEMD